MRVYLLPEKANYYKANLHCHTTVSDGCLTPEEVRDAYRAKGYSVVAFTDHEVLLPHRDLTDDGFLALHGYETAIKDGGVTCHTDTFLKTCHLNLIAKDPENVTQVCFFPENFTPGNCKNYLPFVRYTGPRCRYEYTPEFINHLISEARANGFLVMYNHPHWSIETYADYAPRKGLTGVEVHNTGCVPNGDCIADAYEDFLRMGNRMIPVAADDNHNGNGFADSFGGWNVIAAEKLTYEAVISAIEKGDTYASSGPEIRALYVEDGVLTVHCSPASRVMLIGEGRLARTVKADGMPLSSASFSLDWSKIGAFFRLEVVGEDKETRAFSRGYFRDEAFFN